LPVALGQSPPDPELIYLAMQDKLHQQYRQSLIPGLTEIVASMTPQSLPGLLGVCLSGAGPTILALATGNFEAIAGKIIEQFKTQGISCCWKVLEPAGGTRVIRDAVAR
jgi:homoserine kinase